MSSSYAACLLIDSVSIIYSLNLIDHCHHHFYYSNSDCFLSYSSKAEDSSTTVIITIANYSSIEYSN